MEIEEIKVNRPLLFLATFLLQLCIVSFQISKSRDTLKYEQHQSPVQRLQKLQELVHLQSCTSKYKVLLVENKKMQYKAIELINQVETFFISHLH